ATYSTGPPGSGLVVDLSGFDAPGIKADLVPSTSVTIMNLDVLVATGIKSTEISNTHSPSTNRTDRIQLFGCP
ncbi:hypothetical protein, partial [Pseudomonas sp. DP16D-R1]